MSIPTLKGMEQVALAAIALAAASIAGMFKFLSDNKKAVDNNTKAQNKMTSATQRVASATEKAAREAKERNGHIAELVEQSRKSGEAIAIQSTKEIIGAVKTLKSQSVKEQTVEHQHVTEVRKENPKD